MKLNHDNEGSSNLIKTFLRSVCVLVCMVAATTANAQLDITKLLAATKSASANDANSNTTRENRFKSERNKQQGRLNAMKGERAKQERISDQLDVQFSINQIAIETLQDDLRKELGDLKELFGIIQLTAGEAQEDYKTSLISAHYPERSEKLRVMVAKMASLTDLVSIDELEDLWFELQNEMTEQSKVVKFTAPVTFVSGQQADEEGDLVNVFKTEDREVTRVGVFNAVSGSDIATYDNDRGLVLLEQIGRAHV